MLPVTDEVLLVEDGPVGAEEGVGEQAAVHVPQGTNMECLDKSPCLALKVKYHTFPVLWFQMDDSL